LIFITIVSGKTQKFVHLDWDVIVSDAALLQTLSENEWGHAIFKTTPKSTLVNIIRQIILTKELKAWCKCTKMRE